MSPRCLLILLFVLSTFFVAPLSAQPDLVAAVTSIVPDPVAPGSSISIGWKVTNQGSSSASASGLKLYLSSDSTWDASDIYLSPTESVAFLSAGSAVSGTASRTIPTSTAIGTWYVLAETGDGNFGSRPFTVSSCGGPQAFNLSSPLNGSSQPSAVTSLSLSWTASSGASSYDVYFGPTTSPSFLGNQVATTRIVNVSAGTTYYWKVVAKNSCGQTAAPVSGTWSFSVGLSCSGPGSVSLTSPADGATLTSSTTSATLIWSSASGAASYDVYFGESSSPPFLTNQSGTSASFVVSSGQTYYWRVVAKNDCSTNGSATRSFSVLPSLPIINVVPASTDFGTVAVGLTADRTFTVRNAGGGILTGSAATSFPFSIVAGGSYSLAAGASQAVTVRFTPTLAQTYNGSITFSGGGGTTVQVMGNGAVQPQPILSLSPASLAFGSVAVGSSVDLNFTVQNTGGGTLSGSASVPAPFSIVSGSPYSLTAGQSIFVWVRFAPTSAQDSTAAVSFSGASGASATVSGTGITPTIPAPDPSWLRVTTSSQTQLNLQWDDNSANEDGFKIERKQGCCGPWTEIATLPANYTTYASTGLTCNTTYAYRVWAYNTAGASGKTNEANNTTSACSQLTVPTPDPSWLRVSAASPTQINLQWDDNSTNEDGFKVERKAGCCGPWTEIATLPANSTTYQSSGLTCGGTYAYRVWAFNTQGNSGKTNEAATTTPGC